MFFLQTYFVVTPNDALPDDYDAPTVYMEYAVGRDGFLLRHKSAKNHRGGIMGICLQSAASPREELLLSDILDECNRRQYHGIFLAGNELPQVIPDLLRRQDQFPVYLPNEWASGNLIGILDTALSGGSLREYLAEYSYGKNALYVAKNFVDFALPAENGEGHLLSEKEFRQLYKKYAAQTYFSRELCAHYFTYIDDHRAHFVLFDNIQSIQEKLFLGAQFCFPIAFLPYSLYPLEKKKDGP